MIKRRENVYFLRARAFRTTHTNLGLLFFFLRYELWNVVQNIEKLGSVTRTLIFLIVQLHHKHIGFFAFFFLREISIIVQNMKDRSIPQIFQSTLLPPLSRYIQSKSHKWDAFHDSTTSRDSYSWFVRMRFDKLSHKASNAILPGPIQSQIHEAIMALFFSRPGSSQTTMHILDSWKTH